MAFETYQSFWNHQAATPEGALAGVDGSASEAVVRMTGRWAARQVGAGLGLDGSQRVLELGCGVGRIARELMNQCAHWHGVDISRSMLDVAEERLAEHQDRVALSELQRTALPMVEDESLDAAYSVAVLCHMDKEDLYLYAQELVRALKPGGAVYLETWNLVHPMGWRRWEFEVNNWHRSDQTGRKDVSRNQFCVPEEFALYLERAGLTLLRTWSDSPWIQIVAAKAPTSEQRDAHLARLAEREAEILYPPLFSVLFGELLDVIYGLTPPQEMADALAARDDDPVVSLYRDYLLALWRQGEAHWGPVPADFA